MNRGLHSTHFRIWAPPWPRLIDVMLASVGLWFVSILPTLIHLAGDDSERSFALGRYSIWERWNQALGSPFQQPDRLVSEMGLWIFGPLADCPLALPALVVVAVWALFRGTTTGVRLWAAVVIGAVGLSVGWLAFAGNGAAAGSLPIFVEPVLGAGVSAIGALIVLAPIRLSRRRGAWLDALPGLTAVALLVTLSLALTGGPVGSYARMSGGRLASAYDLAAGQLQVTVAFGLRLFTMLCAVPVLFLAVLLSVRRWPLGRCLSALIRVLLRRPVAFVTNVGILSVLAGAAFLFGTRVIWQVVLSETTSANVAFLGTILTVFSGLTMGIYIYFAARTVLVLVDDPAREDDVPIIPLVTEPMPKRHHRHRHGA